LAKPRNLTSDHSDTKKIKLSDTFFDLAEGGDSAPLAPLVAPLLSYCP